jgi:hypothetical protein
MGVKSSKNTPMLLKLYCFFGSAFSKNRFLSEKTIIRFVYSRPTGFGTEAGFLY